MTALFVVIDLRYSRRPSTGHNNNSCCNATE